MGVDTFANTIGSRFEATQGALQVGDFCLFEDGSERNGAQVSDVVIPETAKHE